MVLNNWIKRLRVGLGTCHISAEGWNRMANALEGIEGVGCRVVKTRSGYGWLIIVDPATPDQPYPDGYPVPQPGASLPVGLVIPAAVEYDATATALVQRYIGWNATTQAFEAFDNLPTWDAEAGEFTEAEEPTIILVIPQTIETRVEYDDTAHKFVQYALEFDAETLAYIETETPADIVTLESHSSQHE